jgi:peptide/nickel transport system ATP-binding protein
MIFQEPMTALNPIMRVGQQIQEVLELHTALSLAQRRLRVIELLDSVRLPQPELVYRAYPFELSGGQRQRVMIAMALALEPRLLIADEPTTALDVTTQAQVLHLIRELQGKLRIGVLFITHDFGVVADIADRIVVMRDGVVVEAGDASQVLDAPREAYTMQLIAAVPGAPAERLAPLPFEPLLSATGLCKTYRGGGRAAAALQDVSLTLGRGEILGVVGESGSGKSTLARVAVGLETPDSGYLSLDGHELAGLSQRQRRPFRRHVQMVFQDPYGSLNPRHRIGEAVAQGPVAFGMAPRAARAKARELLEWVGIDRGMAELYPHQFSGGQRQRIAIARALALDPKVLICDEAVSALDVSIQAQVLRLLMDIRARLGLSILFITHDLRVAAQTCDRIAVMQKGCLVEIGGATSIFHQPQHPYTRQLIAAIPGQSWHGRRATSTAAEALAVA